MVKDDFWVQLLIKSGQWQEVVGGSQNSQYNCRSPNSTEPNITKVGVDIKVTLQHHPPPETQSQNYLSCY